MCPTCNSYYFGKKLKAKQNKTLNHFTLTAAYPSNTSLDPRHLVCSCISHQIWKENRTRNETFYPHPGHTAVSEEGLLDLVKPEVSTCSWFANLDPNKEVTTFLHPLNGIRMKPDLS